MTEKPPTFKLGTNEGALSSEAIIGRENILEGRGLHEISRVGWAEYRRRLAEIPYGEIAKREVEKIKSLRRDSAGVKWYEEGFIIKKNREAFQRVQELSKWLTTEYARNGPFSFFAGQSNKKLTVQGRKEGGMCTKEGDPIDHHCTRIYFTVPTMNSPEAFKLLFSHLVDAGVMDRISLTLNLETFQGDFEKLSQDNTLIIYIFQNNPDLLTRVCKAIAQAKSSSTKEWEMGSSAIAHVKESMLKNFEIPLDDTTAFVESDNSGSYHSNYRPYMYHELTGSDPANPVPLDELVSDLKRYTPEKPGKFSYYPQLRYRRMYSPGLNFFEEPKS